MMGLGLAIVRPLSSKASSLVIETIMESGLLDALPVWRRADKRPSKAESLISVFWGLIHSSPWRMGFTMVLLFESSFNPKMLP